jgi:hypothetical protein
VWWFVTSDGGLLSRTDPPSKIESRVPITSTVEANTPSDAVEHVTGTVDLTSRVDSFGTRRPLLERPLRLQVLNGCGVKGLARVISPALRAKGFDVRETRNASHFKYAHSAVIDRTGDLNTALAFADSLGIDHSYATSESAKSLVDIDITLLVGADYRSLHLDLADHP